MKELSSVLSEAIDQALEDMEACKNDPRYEINFDYWHSPERGKCYVCLAGSVIAKRFNVPFNELSLPYFFPEKKENILRALNCVRKGKVSGALTLMGIEVPKGLKPYFEFESKDYNEVVSNVKEISLELKKYNL